MDYSKDKMFCRIQNLHISQTIVFGVCLFVCFVEFKIYISLKRVLLVIISYISFVEFKIYISLKQLPINDQFKRVLQNSKFTYLSNKITITYHTISVLQNSKFTYLSNRNCGRNSTCQVLQNSKFTYLSNKKQKIILEQKFCRIQNLHISQTKRQQKRKKLSFVEFKIYISLKQWVVVH